MEEGEKEKEIGGKRGRGTRKVENREEEIIGDVGEEWRKEGGERERECMIGRRRVEEKVEHTGES